MALSPHGTRGAFFQYLTHVTSRTATSSKPQASPLLQPSRALVAAEEPIKTSPGSSPLQSCAGRRSMISTLSSPILTARTVPSKQSTPDTTDPRAAHARVPSATKRRKPAPTPSPHYKCASQPGLASASGPAAAPVSRSPLINVKMTDASCIVERVAKSFGKRAAVWALSPSVSAQGKGAHAEEGQQPQQLQQVDQPKQCQQVDQREHARKRLRSSTDGPQRDAIAKQDAASLPETTTKRRRFDPDPPALVSAALSSSDADVDADADADALVQPRQKRHLLDPDVTPAAALPEKRQRQQSSLAWFGLDGDMMLLPSASSTIRSDLEQKPDSGDPSVQCGYSVVCRDERMASNAVMLSPSSQTATEQSDTESEESQKGVLRSDDDPSMPDDITDEPDSGLPSAPAATDDDIIISPTASKSRATWPMPLYVPEIRSSAGGPKRGMLSRLEISHVTSLARAGMPLPDIARFLCRTERTVATLLPLCLELVETVPSVVCRTDDTPNRAAANAVVPTLFSLVHPHAHPSLECPLCQRRELRRLMHDCINPYHSNISTSHWPAISTGIEGYQTCSAPAPAPAQPAEPRERVRAESIDKRGRVGTGSPRMKRGRWTKADRQVALQKHLSGVPLRRIACLLNRPMHTCQRIIQSELALQTTSL